MIPGPDQIIACPHCSALAKHLTLISGNAFGASVWTDGKQILPMLPRQPVRQAPRSRRHGEPLALLRSWGHSRLDTAAQQALAPDG